MFRSPPFLRHFRVDKTPLFPFRDRLVSSQHIYRSMTSIRSTTAPPKTDWLVIIHDHVGVLEKRMEVRPRHLEGLQPNVESGFWKMGGAMLEKPYQEGAGLKIIGSAMMAHAATKEEVLEMIEKDIYIETGVWDLEKVQVYPFKTAFRIP